MTNDGVRGYGELAALATAACWTISALAFTAAVRASGRAATSYNWRRLKDFRKLIRQGIRSRGTTLASDTDRGQAWAVEIGATVRGSSDYVGVYANSKLTLPETDVLSTSAMTLR